MGIYDREYYRGEKSGMGWFQGPTPWVKTIIFINVVVFVFQKAFPVDESFVVHWLAASPEGIFQHGRVWQLLTATFLHDANIFHILGNMLFLWIVGREMESMYGGRDFLAFYLAAAVVSTFVWAVADAMVPGDRFSYMVGASGAVMAVLTLYTLYYPKREILLLFIPMPMWVLLGLYLVMPLLADSRNQVAVESHLAGAAFGWAFKHFDLRWSRFAAGRSRRPRLTVVTPPRYDQQTRPRTTVSTRGTSSDAVGVRSSSTGIPEDQLDARLDEVLAKIATVGRDGLTEDERNVLEEASRRARDRRSDRR